MSKHTPGPWHIRKVATNGTVYEGGDRPYTISSPGGAVICLGARQGRESTDLNARLIAAAPELLEAAKQAIKDAKQNMRGGRYEGAEMSENTMNKLIDAIAKAEGKLTQQEELEECNLRR